MSAPSWQEPLGEQQEPVAWGSWVSAVMVFSSSTSTKGDEYRSRCVGNPGSPVRPDTLTLYP